jgi:hypothetical protein
MRDWAAVSERANVHASRGWNLGSLDTTVELVVRYDRERSPPR